MPGYYTTFDLWGWEAITFGVAKEVTPYYLRQENFPK